MTTHLGAPTWIDLATTDLDGAKHFYGAVFGWSFDTPGPDYGGYVNAAKDGKLVAGLMPSDPQWNSPDRWSTYLHTPDIEATLEAVAAAGGTSCSGVMDVGDKGRMAILNDPAGTLLGLWQPGTHHGFEVTGQAGSPVWHQLTVTDYRAALDFYTQVFGWETRTESDTADFKYTNALFGGEPVLGVMDGVGLVPQSEWSVFLGADDVDKTLQMITDNGGSIVRDADDTPYGRLAAAADPTGARFNLSSLR
jgi:predicted enzyme related to lactoylglutathione lyase